MICKEYLHNMRAPSYTIDLNAMHEVEKAYREAMDHVGGVFPKIRDDLQSVVDINFASSSARKVATGELNK